MSDIPSDWLWIVILAFIIAFLLAFGIGANDVANAFGTSVGSKVITLLKACILASIFEVLGAVLIGYRVSDTIRKGIIDPMQYNNSEKLLAMGNLSALTGSCIWMFIATLLRLPVSATHSIVGATIGFSLVAKGARGIGWGKLGFIIGSWFLSPVTSGLISVLLFVLVRRLVLNKDKPLEPGLKMLPLFYAFTVCVNALSVFLDGSELLYFDRIPNYGGIIISLGLSVIVAVVVKVCVVPWMRKRIMAGEDSKSKDGKTMDKIGDIVKTEIKSKQTTNFLERFKRKSKNYNGKNGLNQADRGDSKMLDRNKADEDGLWKTDGENGLNCKDVHFEIQPLKTSNDKDNLLGSTTLGHVCKSGHVKDVKIVSDAEAAHWKVDKKQLGREMIEDKPETKILFSFLQILTAIFGSFAHGGNDVSNAIGPLIGVWMICNEGSVAQKAPTPIWILVYGGAGISFGLWILGRRVIQTIGEDLAKVTPSSGFCIEIGAATTVLLASYLGLPISTTHCKVGSIIFTGRVRSNENVDWSLFRNIFIAWVVTLPASGALSALMMFLLERFAL
ncbi:sodium-dependent phosphate transporter 1-B-like isoform X1 [Biomphalaria glabrata]|uniref:Phosphate transporter n=1 Tax=Biomphalaria glabrata TaxID=6526 RepID=A0A9W2ZBJ1_BIOGL|nr:sodium-dependent phosphate transporter 1-B-like isoform X1 [Biomphalaria glabrata]